MNTLILKICLICCLLKISHGNITTSLYKNHNNNNDTRILPDGFSYYITGGRHADKIEYVKSMVSIRTRSPQTYFGDNHYCAGAIITENIVLTAAHCVMDKRRVLYPARRMLLVAGTPNRLEPTSKTKQFPVKKVKADTRFVRKNKHDIAIIRLQHKIPRDNDYIKTINLPNGQPPYNNMCTVLGWGRVLAQGPLAANALQIDIKLMSPEKCKESIGDHYYEGILCAGDNTVRSAATCRGDTGGPLICNNELTGIISWTIGCGNTTNPSLFMDVFFHKKWILQFINAAARLDFKISILIFGIAILLV